MDDITTETPIAERQTHPENDMTPHEVWEAIRAGHFRGEQGTH